MLSHGKYGALDRAIVSFIPQQTHANKTLIGDRLKQIDVENDPLELVSIFFFPSFFLH